MIGVAVVPVLIASGILGVVSSNESSLSLENAAQRQLVSIRDARKTQIEDYFLTIQNQITTLSNDLMVIDAMNEFKNSFAQLPSFDEQQYRYELQQNYSQNFLTEYKNMNDNQSFDVNKLIAPLDRKAVYWQWHYIKNNGNPLGSKHQLNRASEENRYNIAHERFHPKFTEYLDKFGYYDIFLVDAKSGDIVYSVFKEVDYATSLKTGPYSNSGLAQAYKMALNNGKKDAISLIDFKPYLPSYQAQASFMTSPIADESGSLIGVLVFQMPIGRINNIMTSNGQWQESGLGLSGETYLVGNDSKARSLSRFLIEDPNGFLDVLIKAGTSSSEIKEISDKSSNIGIQKIITKGVESAQSGQTGFSIFPDYRGVSVLSAYTPLAIKGLDWVLMSEIDADEAFAGAIKIKNKIIVDSIVTVVAVSVIAIVIGILVSKSITVPITGISELISKVESENNLTYRSELSANDEIGDMARSFNSMLERISSVLNDVSSSTHMVATASEELTIAANENVQGVESQKLETEQIATAIHQMAITVQDVASSTSEASAAAIASNQQAEKGKEVVTKSVNAIQNLSDNIDKASIVIKHLEKEGMNIDSVTEVIKTISEQTNLLALNAAIEAARAGEHGRGFAVVADEVRTLAQKTQDSIQEIEQTVERLRLGIDEAVQAMTSSKTQADLSVELTAQAATSLDEIAMSSTQISDYNAQIASAAEQQSATSEDMNRSIASISDIAIQTSASSEESAVSSEELARLSAKLQELVAQFKIV